MMEYWPYFAFALSVVIALLLIASYGDRDSPTTRRWIINIVYVCFLQYLTWRVYTLVTTFDDLSGAWFISFLFFLIEATTAFLVYRDLELMVNKKSRSADVDKNIDWHKDRPAPLIDILIVTYNEKREIVERAICGAVSASYPNFRVWVLDDGRREWMGNLAKEYGANYLTRESNAGYKAGNLNNGIAHILSLEEKPEFFAILDADFIIKPNFLTRTLALMHDPTVGIVQTPQHFYNPDPFQYIFRSSNHLPDEQRIWYDHRMPCWDAHGFTMCCGTSFLLRAAALEQYGKGFPTNTVSEDAMLAAALRHIGWRTIYLNEILSTGLSPEGMKEFIVQRMRWCLGGLQVTLSEYGPRRYVPGWKGHFYVFESFARWIWFPFTRVALTLFPALYFFFGNDIFRADSIGFWAHNLPMFISLWGLAWIHRFAFMPILIEAYFFLLLPYYIKAAKTALTGKQAKFEVTDKGINRSKTVFYWEFASVPLFFLVAVILVVLYAIHDDFSALHSAPDDISFLLYWGCITVVTLYIAISPCFEPPKYRNGERYLRHQPITLHDGSNEHHAVEVFDLSEGGCRVRSNGLVVGQDVSVDLSPIGRIKASVVRQVRKDEFGLKFLLDFEQKKKLLFEIYCSGSYVPEIKTWNFFGSIASVAKQFART